MILPYRKDNAEVLFLWQTNKKYRSFFRDIDRYLTFEECLNLPQVMGFEVFVYYDKENNMAGLLTAIDLKWGVYEMGFMIDKDHEGKGEAREMVFEFIDYLENVRGARKIIGKLLASAERNRNICVRNGFREVGILEKNVFLEGNYEDVVIIEKFTRREI